MKEAGQLALPVICRGIDSLDVAVKKIFEDSTPEERRKFYEDVKKDIQNQAYCLEARQFALYPKHC